MILLLPRFTPRVPRWAQAVLPPRYRRARDVLPEHAADEDAAAGADGGEKGEDGAEGRADGGEREPALAGLNGATAIGDRRSFTRPKKINNRR